MTSHRLAKDHFFTHIMIDEGAQIREPEAIAPLYVLLTEPQRL